MFTGEQTLKSLPMFLQADVIPGVIRGRKCHGFDFHSG